jgi:hypothetical protein
MGWRSVAAVGLATVAIVTAGQAWREDVPDLTATDAVVAMEDALESIGLEATVAPDPVSTTYASRTREPVAVWAVRATVRSEPIELQLARSGAHPVAIDDRNRDQTSYVLSELEYEALATNIDDPGRTRTIRRNVVLTVAAILVIALALAHAATIPRKEQP